MRWFSFRSGVPYTCQECPAFVEIRRERDRWHRIASMYYYCVEGADRAFAEYDKAVRGERPES